MPDSKKEKENLIPWEEEEGRKEKPERGGGIPPKTNIQSRVHSKSKTEGQEYLDMYIRSKEKERMERFGGILSKRLRTIADFWRDLKKDMLRKEEELPKVPKGGVKESEKETNKEAKPGKKTPGHMKKMDWNY